MKIKEYVTAFGNTPRELDDAVNKLIAKGWQPFGNPYASENPVKHALEHMLLAQARIKTEG